MRISDWSSDVCSSDLFSISNAGAAASGLSVYDAGSGVRDVTLMVSGRFAVTQRIGVGAMAGVSRLLGDAADSQVVEDRGDDTPLFGGAFVHYSFCRLGVSEDAGRS